MSLSRSDDGARMMRESIWERCWGIPVPLGILEGQAGHHPARHQSDAGECRRMPPALQIMWRHIWRWMMTGLQWVLWLPSADYAS